MKSKVITLMVIGTMLATGVFSGIALAEMGSGPAFEDRQERRNMNHEKRLEVMAGVLDLSETQLEKIRAIHEQERAEMEATRQQMQQGREQMRALLDSDSFDENAVRSLARSQESLKTDMFVARARAKHEVSQLLTAEQQELAKKIKPLMHDQGKHRSPRRGLQ